MFGIGLQELAMITVFTLTVVFQIRMLIDAWRQPHSMIFRLIWSVVIITIPIMGAALYWWFVKVGDFPKRNKI